MIKLIGIKRALILAILLSANLAIAGVFFFGILPMRAKASAELTKVQSDIASLQSKINNVKKELADFKRNLPKYENLKSVGFFSPQDRFQLERDLNKVQEISGLQGFSYTVSEVQTLENAEAKKSKSRIIRSEIKIENPFALVDRQFYDFVHVMMQDFPAHIRLKSFALARKGELDNDTLAKVRTQEIRSLMNANAVFEWMTIVPEETPDSGKSGWGR